MDDALLVRLARARARSASRSASARVDGERPVGERSPERLALDELHRDEDASVLGLADLVDGRDVGMIQRPPRDRASRKKRAAPIGSLATPAEDLERDRAPSSSSSAR